MIIAGIDEAGYGPVLGPLVVACCAVETPSGEELPCLWKRLSRMAGKSRDKRGQKLHINDSKQVYSPTAGLKELERAVLCLIEQAHTRPACLDDVLGAIDPTLLASIGRYKWYANTLDACFPVECDPAAFMISSNAWRIECDKAGTRCVHYSAHVMLEGEFNDMVARTRNKASASFNLVARHIDAMLRRFGGQDLVIVCDRQGGREHYGHLLRVMFEDWALEITSESEKRAEYRLVNGPRSARIIFCEKAESIALPVAAGSMLAKYVRESLMHRFNRYWQQHLPTLAPTAGYYTDGWRFLRDIEPVRTRLGVRDGELIRSR